MSTLKSSAENLTLNADGSNNDVIIQSNGSTKVTVDGQNSRVGIGTATPLSSLHIQSSASSGVSAPSNALLCIENNTGCGIGLLSNNDRQQTINFGDPEDNNVGFINYGHDTNQMSFNVNAAERMRITANGVTFNGDTAAANALDDYEEGTFTPVVTASSGSATYSTQTGTYTKIGNVVTINVAVQANKNNLSGPLKVSLPIACGAENRGQEYDWYVPGGLAILTSNVRISASASVMALYGNTAASVDGTGRQYQASDVAGEMYFWMSITYKV